MTSAKFAMMTSAKIALTLAIILLLVGCADSCGRSCTWPCCRCRCPPYPPDINLETLLTNATQIRSVLDTGKINNEELVVMNMNDTEDDFLYSAPLPPNNSGNSSHNDSSGNLMQVPLSDVDVQFNSEDREKHHKWYENKTETTRISIGKEELFSLYGEISQVLLPRYLKYQCCPTVKRMVAPTRVKSSYSTKWYDVVKGKNSLQYIHKAFCVNKECFVGTSEGECKLLNRMQWVLVTSNGKKGFHPISVLTWCVCLIKQKGGDETGVEQTSENVRPVGPSWSQSVPLKPSNLGPTCELST